MKLRSSVLSIILLGMLTGLIVGSENYLEPAKTEGKKKESSEKTNTVSKLVEVGEGLRLRAKKQSQNAMEMNRIKGHLRMLTSQQKMDDERVIQAVNFYKNLVEEYDLESTKINDEALRLIGEMAPFHAREKLSREESILLGRVYLLTNQTEEMIKVFESIRAKTKLVADEYLELVRAYNQFNETEVGIKLINEALKEKLEFAQKSELEFALAQNLFWNGAMKEAILLLKELERFPETRTRASRILISYDETYRQFQQELEYRKADKDLPRVEIVTSRGSIILELFEDDAPNAVANFITLAESKFYDKHLFHRVLPSFMAQGGDPNSKDADPSNDGIGGPGYKIKTEISKRNHFRGVISYANSGKDTDGSQFFLTVIPTSWLNGKHAVFGRVLEGMKVVDGLRKGDAIQTVKVLSRRNHTYTVKKL